jgi:hypothetical protein
VGVRVHRRGELRAPGPRVDERGEERRPERERLHVEAAGEPANLDGDGAMHEQRARAVCVATVAAVTVALGHGQLASSVRGSGSQSRSSKPRCR